MKTEEEIKEAQQKLYERWYSDFPKMSEQQVACLSGMIAAMAWLFESENNTVFQRVIDGEPFK